MAVRDHNTPLSPEELADLIPNLATKQELNEWERENILQARQWAIRDRTRLMDLVSDAFVRKLHFRMFDQTWKWAGRYRTTDKNIGVPFAEIPERLAVLFGDVRFWIENLSFSHDESVVRFHHRLVAIHPFPNGNGRHGRLIADLLAVKLGQPAFTWGRSDLIPSGDARARYLESLTAADRGDLQPLLIFVRS